ncbi:MAG TPA: hypothetical protein PLZ68_09405 [Ferruginibacter sp.]|nr:hypothetical protein [Ferruginibacter sp.]
MKNKITIGAIAFLSVFASCKKEESAKGPLIPGLDTISIDLRQQEIHYGAAPVLLDFDNDGTRDFIFNVTLVGDPLLGVDKRKFMAGSGIHSLFAVNDQQQVPCMNKGENISLENFNGYDWNLVSAVMLVERWENATGQITWHGNWKGAVKKYLPFQIVIDSMRHTGWVELSIDIASQKVVLHRAAYTKEPEKEIKAGE